MRSYIHTSPSLLRSTPIHMSSLCSGCLLPRVMHTSDGRSMVAYQLHLHPSLTHKRSVSKDGTMCPLVDGQSMTTLLGFRVAYSILDVNGKSYSKSQATAKSMNSMQSLDMVMGCTQSIPHVTTRMAWAFSVAWLVLEQWEKRVHQAKNP